MLKILKFSKKILRVRCRILYIYFIRENVRWIISLHNSKAVAIYLITRPTWVGIYIVKVIQ